MPDRSYSPATAIRRERNSPGLARPVEASKTRRHKTLTNRELRTLVRFRLANDTPLKVFTFPSKKFPSVPQPEQSRLGAVIRWSLAFFFLSGTTGLVYQVLWTRRLTLTFGHTVLAVSTVLTAFMAGLALGSLLAGRWSDKACARDVDPVKFLAYYGVLEAFIGVWALLSLPLLGVVESLYLHLSTSGVSGTSLYLACFAGSMIVLVPPTTAMGATVPVMSRLLVHERGDIGRLLSRLYGINTLGAFTGAGLAGFILLPTLGLTVSMCLAAAVNLSIGGIAVLLVKTSTLSLGPNQQLETEADDKEAPASPFPTWLVPLTFGLAGISSMAFQVGWTRGLALSLGSSVYAFSSILVTFLAGLGLGSLLYPKLMRGKEPTLTHLGLLQLGIGVLGAATIPVLGYFPYLFFQLFPLVGDSFFKVLALDVLLSGLLLIGPTFLMGLAFPLATHLYTEKMAELGKSVGEVYSANTFGCIAGAFLSGFLMIPNLGAQATLKTAALLYLVIGIALFLVRTHKQDLTYAGLSLLACFGLWWIPQWEPGVMAGGVAVYAGRHQHLNLDQARRTLFRPPAYYEDGLSCTVSINYYGNRAQEMAMRVNGKVDASLGRQDKQTMFLTGYLPAILHPQPKKVAVVGLGSGFTLQALAEVPEVEQIECAELEPAVVEVGKFWAGYNGHVLDNPKVRMHVTDGRTFILGSPQQYDIIASEPSNPWIAGIGNLFTRDFYQTCSQRLAPGGIMCQWFNLYAVSNSDLKMVLHSYYSVFPHGMVWQSAAGDLLLIGANQPVQMDTQRLLDVYQANPQIQRHFYEIGLYEPESFLGHYLFDREVALAEASQAPFNTDDRPLLEFSAPKSLYNLDQMRDNLEFLRQRHTGDLPPGVEPTPRLLTLAAFAWLNQDNLPTVKRILSETQEGSEQLALLAALAGSQDEQLEKADPLFAGALEAYPESGLIAAQWASYLIAENREQEAAAELLSRALEAPPAGSRSALHNQLGLLLSKLGQLESAIENYRLAMEAYPEDGLAYALLGHALLESQQPEEAISLFGQSLERNATDPLSWAGLGQAQFAAGQPDSAIVSLKKALELIPDQTSWLMNLGIAQLKTGQIDQARETFTAVLDYQPAHEGALNFLSQINL